MSISTDPLDLAGRVAIITGGTRGIGLATAHSLAGHGASVVILGRADLGAATDAASAVASRYGTPAVGLIADASDPAAIRTVYGEVRAEFGRLDILVNNAGILQDALVGMITDDMVNETLAVNTAGPIHHVQAAARLMRKSGGSMINLTSIIGREGNVGQVVYAASKAAVIGLTLSAAKELAPLGVRVNAVAPGFIDTDMTNALPPEKFAERVTSVKMGRIGTPDEVANTILYLASDMSTYVTGQVIGVDGGMLI